MAQSRSTANPERVRRLRLFQQDSLDDYLAARLLLLSGHTKQGAVLGSTAIEKSFKAILAMSGNESHGHLKKAHWNAVKNFNAALFARLDPDFLLLSQKAYKLRYTDDLTKHFNLAIASREFLAALDRTVMNVLGGFKLTLGEKKEPTEFQQLVDAGDDRIVMENRVLSQQDVTDFIYEKRQHVYEVRNDPQMGLFEISYVSSSRPRRPGFLREALIPKAPFTPRETSYDLTHEVDDGS